MVQMGGWGRRSPFSSRSGMSRVETPSYGFPPKVISSQMVTPLGRESEEGYVIGGEEEQGRDQRRRTVNKGQGGGEKKKRKGTKVHQERPFLSPLETTELLNLLSLHQAHIKELLSSGQSKCTIWEENLVAPSQEGPLGMWVHQKKEHWWC